MTRAPVIISVATGPCKPVTRTACQENINISYTINARD